ncbi:MAG: RdgB/HAM1 family non-canonical purine NTP pyrophosphatase [Nitrososphaeria archaeon]|nr:RdgB/HAM1 family non-canonical purine NTP pyrophosphatase [Nitrosopumilaceae archaeon]NIP10495.1 RdgB/HAM1 family non-canonical purine NTP pyrophosphatase [Nitrosopumilaceae archaeon]NIP90905.1 RdgB/HAM1 family non-canonical purine NTP pyrophosphatase [Nitrososphaeria archaeon]NIS94521.1 RdgB/HAM1 family non-canonical purine NTP pyrophosphatase [Nitrosopumilaceae archaeon]
MQQSFDLLFASSNLHKFQEAKKILEHFGIKLGFYKCNLEEIQSNSLKEIANHKSKQAFQNCKKPVIVEDDGLFIESLGGFPGPYSSYVFKTIGNKGILNLLKQKRKAKFVSVISFCDKRNIISFESYLDGTISKKIIGKGWGYDPIFIPFKSKLTFAKLKDKNEISHRYKALKKFSNWYFDK